MTNKNSKLYSWLYIVLFCFLSLGSAIYSFFTHDHDWVRYGILLVVFYLLWRLMSPMEWKINVGGASFKTSFDFGLALVIMTNPLITFIFYAFVYLVDYFSKKEDSVSSLENYLLTVSNFQIGYFVAFYFYSLFFTGVPEFSLLFVVVIFLCNCINVTISRIIISGIWVIQNQYQYVKQLATYFKTQFIYARLFIAPIVMLIVYFYYHEQYIAGVVFLGLIMFIMQSMLQVNESVKAKAELQSAKQAMLTDDLTKVYNVRFLNNEFYRFELERENVGICVADIDHFKRINDTHGHDVGDQALKHCVNIMKNVLQEEDLLVRSGGEEFTMLLKKKTYDECLQVIEQIRKNIEESELYVLKNGQHIKITFTVSFGLYFYEAANETLPISEAWIEADKLLYESKQTGRNKVSINKK